MPTRPAVPLLFGPLSRHAATLALLAMAALLAACAADPAPRAAPTAPPAHLPGAPAAQAFAPFGEQGRWQVAYSDTGGGPAALVLVHGWASDRGVWREQIAGLAAEHRVLAVDLIGHGASSQPEVPYTMDFMADSLQAVLEHAGVERAVLVGHSNGTPVIRQLLRRHPGRVAGLVAVDGALRPLTTDRAQMQAFADRFRGDDYLTHVETGGRQMLSPQLDAARREELLAMMRAVPQHVLVSSLAESFDPTLWESDPIRVPLLVIRAESPFWNEAARAYAEQLAPRLEYHVLRNVTHFLMLDEPHTFRLLVLDFVERHGLLEG